MSTFAGLRLLLVGPVPPPAGGMANQTRQLRELLLQAGADVALLPTNAPYRPSWVGRVPVLRALFRLAGYLVALWLHVGRAQVVHVMANSGWSWHLFAAPALWVSWLRRVPVVVNYRGGEAGEFLARSAGLVRLSMRRAARLVVPSGFLEAVFRGHAMASEVVPNIIDTQRFRPAAADEPRPAQQLLVARNLESIYGNDVALRAFALVRHRHPRARLVIAGSGPLQGSLQALAAELGVADGVQFTGRLERDPMAALLRASTVSINPTRVDNMPNSVLEAMASGVPVVSTAVGGVPYIVRDGETALLVAADDPQAMADAACRLLDDPQWAHSLAERARADVQRYTWAHVAPRWAAVYRQALERSPARALTEPLE